MYELRIRLRLTDHQYTEQQKQSIIDDLVKNGVLASFCWSEKASDVQIVKTEDAQPAVFTS